MDHEDHDEQLAAGAHQLRNNRNRPLRAGHKQVEVNGPEGRTAKARMDEEERICGSKNGPQDGTAKRESKQVCSNRAHEQREEERKKTTAEANLGRARSERIEQQLEQHRACCAHDLLCFHSTSANAVRRSRRDQCEGDFQRDPDNQVAHRQTSGLECSSASSKVSCDCVSSGPPNALKVTCEYFPNSESLKSFHNFSAAPQGAKCSSHPADYRPIEVFKSCLDNRFLDHNNYPNNHTNHNSNRIQKSACCSSESNAPTGDRPARLQSKTVHRIGVFYSDLCDVVRSMRSFSSQSNNSSFKSDKPDKENLLDYSNERPCSLNSASTKVAKTMVKTPLAQQRPSRRNSEPPSQQPNGLTQPQQTSQPQPGSKPNATAAKLKMTGGQQSYFVEDKTDSRMNEQLITKDKQSLLSKVTSSEQNLFKPFSPGQLLLQVPATESTCNFDRSPANTNHSTSGSSGSGVDEVDAFRLTSQQQSYNVSNASATTVAVNGQTVNGPGNGRPAVIPMSNLPDLLQTAAHAHPPPAYSTFQAPSLLSPYVDQCPPIGTLSLRQIARLQHQSIPINSLPANLTSPLSLNIARSRNSTAALLTSAPLSPSNLLNAARVHQPLSADAYRNTLGNPALSSVPNSSNTLPSAVPLSTVGQPSVVPPPHVHHHPLRFPLGPLNGHRFTSSGFLGADLDAITQSKSCLSCTSMGLRWGILLIAFIGLLSAIVGTCLFAVRPSGRDNFTLAIILLGKSRFLLCPRLSRWLFCSYPFSYPLSLSVPFLAM